MNCTGLQGITVLDFHLSLSTRISPEDCRGPIVYLDLSEQVMDRLATAVVAIGNPKMLQDTVVGTTSRSEVRCGSCAAHWLDLASVTSIVGQNHQRKDMHFVANIIMKQVCATLGWDYRELSNYMSSKASLGRSQE